MFSRPSRRELDLRDWTAEPGPHEPVLVASPEDLARWVPSVPLADLSRFDQTKDLERAWVRRVAAQELRSGPVVELGSWLGAATYAIALGLSERSGGPVPFHTYDQFTFQDQSHVAGVGGLEGYREGGSFRELFDERMAGIGGLVEVHEGPIEDARWDGDDPIELLFHDVSKTWTTWLAVRRTFYPALRPGSIVVEQDFGHPFTPWLHLSHHRWRECFEPLGAVPSSGSVAFRMVRPVPAEELERDDLVDGFTPREIQEAFDWAQDLTAPWHREQVAAARVVLYELHGDVRTAISELCKAVDDGILGLPLASELLPGLAERLGAGGTGAGRVDATVTSLLRRRRTEQAVHAFFGGIAEGRLDAPMTTELLPLVARHEAAAKRHTTSSARASRREAREVEERAASARQRGDLWCAY